MICILLTFNKCVLGLQSLHLKSTPGWQENLNDHGYVLGIQYVGFMTTVYIEPSNLAIISVPHGILSSTL